MDQAHAPAHPAQRRGQRDIVGPQSIGGRFNAGRALHGGHDSLDVRERARKARRQMVRQQTEGAMTLWTVPARDLRPRRGHPRVGAVLGIPTPTLGVQRAIRQACTTPGLSGNVVFAGVPRLVSKLHRQLARVGGDLRGPSYSRRQLPTVAAGAPAENPRAPSAAAGRAWTVCGRPADRGDNAKSRVAPTRPQTVHPRPELRSGGFHHALRA